MDEANPAPQPAPAPAPVRNEIGVLFRGRAWQPVTKEDYQDSIRLLLDASTQLEPNGLPCAVCGRPDHHAWVCHHNPLAMGRAAAVVLGATPWKGVWK